MTEFLVMGRNNGMIKRGSNRRGFTLVELSLSMVFIAILSIIIVLVINGAISSYSRGITLNLVNTVGTEIMNEMKTAIHEAPTFESFDKLCDRYYGENSSDSNLTGCKEDGASGLMSVIKRGTVGPKNGGESIEVPLYGALCLGNYSYLWNSGYLFNPDYEIEDGAPDEEVDKLVLMTKLPDSEDEPIPVWSGRLLRVKDNNRWVCTGLMSQSPESLPIPKTYKKELELGSLITERSLTDLDLTYTIADDSNDGGVAVYDLQLVPSPVIGDGVLYTVYMTLGTARSGINIDSLGGSCATRAETNNNFDYCAINRFKITALASGGTKK